MKLYTVKQCIDQLKAPLIGWVLLHNLTVLQIRRCNSPTMEGRLLHSNSCVTTRQRNPYSTPQAAQDPEVRDLSFSLTGAYLSLYYQSVQRVDSEDDPALRRRWESDRVMVKRRRYYFTTTRGELCYQLQGSGLSCQQTKVADHSRL